MCSTKEFNNKRSSTLPSKLRLETQKSNFKIDGSVLVSDGNKRAIISGDQRISKILGSYKENKVTENAAQF